MTDVSLKGLARLEDFKTCRSGLPSPNTQQSICSTVLTALNRSLFEIIHDELRGG